MSQQERRVQPESQATPLSEDLVQMLQGRIDADGFSAPTASQREAGTAVRQFLNSGPAASTQQTRQILESGPAQQIAQQGPAPLPDRLAQSLQQTQSRQREEALADLREQFGARGSRFGTSIGRGSSDLLTQLANRQTQQEFDLRNQIAGQRLQAGQQQLAAAGQLANQQLQNARTRLQGIEQASLTGQRAISPFIQLGSRGILPEEIAFEPHPLVQGAQAVGGLARGAGALATGLSA